MSLPSVSSPGPSDRGRWVPAIPLPLYVLGRKRCSCGRGFWRLRNYHAHYALVHILGTERR